MKKILSSLQKGERIEVQIVEIQKDDQILVAYEGHLFRIKNTSGKRFEIAETISLTVTQKEPLLLSLTGADRLFSRTI